MVRAIVRREQALIQQEEQRIINPALSYYHLISDQPDKQLEYQCRKREGWYSLEEKAPLYDVVMAQMESGHY
ncbi:hypothetical protein [Reichenbachiella ulvae]|uniref:Uncharacterized protein n=1 Tax=Reichenbachiella ulvae TaxID=2980104 RepID=A0ABT3CW75_9BACT|nr:hypothetical protein [Reichenbachiella ulvae]MCV9387803.1 hypothetical protein [Reichenbachiella ulvae]